MVHNFANEHFVYVSTYTRLSNTVVESIQTRDS